MPKKRHWITPKATQEICAFIRAGAYPHVAAEAAGVPKEEFDLWMHKGTTQKRGRSDFRAFAEQVRKAMAQARLRAEMKVLEEDPLAWLRSGPGKEQGDRPGWTT